MGGRNGNSRLLAALIRRSPGRRQHHRLQSVPLALAPAVWQYSPRSAVISGVSWREHESGMCAMDNEVITQTKADREILSFDVSDELLERAVNAEQSGFTLAYCTSYWDSCGLPTVAR